MKAYALTDKGRVRTLNEDNFYLPAEGEEFCAVADGMGGHNAGEIASGMAVRTFASAMRKALRPSQTALYSAVMRANGAVYSEACRDERKSGMGTTFTALSREGDIVHIAHIGDSRCYLVRNGSISRVTQDHSLVDEMVRHGLISQREARNHPNRNVITRALGIQEMVEADLIDMDLRPGDVYLLCTDGLSNHVEEHEMIEITDSDLTWPDKIRKLIDTALNAGGRDNITAMYITFEEN